MFTKVEKRFDMRENIITPNKSENFIMNCGEKVGKRLPK